jgi:diguanylate cyclase (GGDEF)-like protein
LISIGSRPSTDIIARLGGDEFAVLALEASGESAEALVDRLRERFREFSESTRESYRLGASIGMARHDGDLRMRLEDLLAEADTGMYREKRDKRDMVAR